jgi:cation transport ATPase
MTLEVKQVSSQNHEELQRKVEEVKQDADVQHVLQQANATEKTEDSVGRARARDKFWLATHLFFLIVLGALYAFVKYRLPQFDLLLKPILAIVVVVV